MSRTARATTDSVGHPFVHVVSHGARWLAYDVNTNALLEVDETLGRVLGALSVGRAGAALEGVARERGREAVGAALAEIGQAQRDEGLFLARRPRVAPPAFGPAERAACDSGLKHLVLSVTSDCNLACRYCPQARAREGGATPRAMPVTTALRALDVFADRCRDTERPVVSFYGGEPLLRLPLIRAVIDRAKRKGGGFAPEFVVDTNATLIDDEAADLVARERLRLQVSLDGPSAAHDRWRSDRAGRGTHAAALAGLERVLRRDPSAARRVTLQATLADGDALEERGAWFARLRRELAPDGGRQLRAEPAALPAGEEGAAGRTRRAGALARARRRWLGACAAGRRGGSDPVARALSEPAVIRFYHRSRRPLPDAVAPGGCCLPGVRRLHARPDGVLEPCERLATALPIGTAARGIDTGQIEALGEAWAAATTGRCEGCWALRLCGLCFAALFKGADGRLFLAPGACDDARSRAEGTLRLYADLMLLGRNAAGFLAESMIS